MQFEESMFQWNLTLLPPSTDFLLGLFFKLEDEGNMRNLSFLSTSAYFLLTLLFNPEDGSDMRYLSLPLVTTGFRPGLLLIPEDMGNMFLQNIELSLNHMVTTQTTLLFSQHENLKFNTCLQLSIWNFTECINIYK
jgi:hypothetical protein